MTALKRLTEAEFTTLKNEISENGAGYALYVKLSRQSNVMGTATPLTQTFADNLQASFANHLPFDRTLPSYNTYSAVFDEYEATSTAAPAPTRTRRAATSPAPAGGGRTTNPRVDPLGVDPLDDPDDDFDDAPIAPVTSRPARQTFAPQGEEPTWLADYDRRAVQPLYDITDDHENRISDLEARPAGAGFGFSAPVGFIAGAIAALLAWLVLALVVHVVGTTLVVLIGLAFVAFFLVGGFAAAGVSVPRATRRA